MADPDQNPLEPDQNIPKPRVIPPPKKTLHYIFGTSKVFQGFDDLKPKVTSLTVPLKIREYYHRGHWCLKQEDWEAAVVYFSRALHLDPQLVELYALRAEAFIQLCDFSSAAQNLRRAYSFKPDNNKYLERLTFVLYLQGQWLYEQCDYLDALNVFLQGCELQPQKSSFRYRCMACLLALKRHQDCLSLITKEVTMGTTNADIYILRARIYNFFQKPSLCYRDLRSALLLDPEHVQARALLQMMVAQGQRAHQDAGILAVQGKLRHALLRINCAIENNPLDPAFFLFRGTIYRRLQEFDGAVEDFLKALDMAPDGAAEVVRQAQRQLLLAYNDFAVRCYARGAYQEGVLLLSKALRGEQREKGLYINRGDCFFQLGNLAFAEADYKQALELSPQDEGANMRMGMLQEKMGFCEQRRRQFQKAEDHFSAAIQHSPHRAQYYLYRAKSRQLLQDVFGARQDVATVLLLNPNQPKIVTLMTNLFPGMSVDQVLHSQVAGLAKLQLTRMVESSQQASCLPGIVGLLRKRELERQKARALQQSWKGKEFLAEASKEPEATPEFLELAEGPAEQAQEEEGRKKREDKLKHAPRKVISQSDSYRSPGSSCTNVGFKPTSTSETSLSTSFEKYRSSSSTTTTTDATFSDSSPLRTESSGSETPREALSLSYSPRRSEGQSSSKRNSSKAEAALDLSQSISKKDLSKSKAAQGPRKRPGKPKAAQSPRQRLRRPKAAQGQSPSCKPSKANAAQGRSCKPSKADAAQGQSPSCKPSKVNAAQGQSPSCKPSKADAAQGQSREPVQTSSKAQAFHDPDRSQSHAKVSQSQSQSSTPGKTEVAQSWSQSTGSSSSKTDSSRDRSPSLTRNRTSEGPSPSASKTEDVEDSHYAAL